MVKFKRNLNIYINQLDTDFIFRQGYSYNSDKIKNGYKVWNVDKSVVVEIVGGEVEEYLEEE